MHKNFFIHIGNHKTGTTAIQNFLHKNENRLKLNKIIYPEIGKTLQYSYNSHNIAWELNGDIRFEQQNKTLSDLYKFISQCNNSIIISSEDLQNLEFDEVKFNQFKNELKKNKFNVKIIIYLRNQIDYFAGFYQINLLLGYPVQNIESVYRALEKNDYIKLKLPLKVKFWFDYYKQIKLIKEMFDIENKDIICRSYDENRNKLIESFLEIINVDNKNSDYENYKNINQSITSLSVSMLEYFNQNRDKFNLSNKETSDIKNILVNRNIFKGEKFIINDKKFEDFMTERFKESNSIVEKEFNISINKFLKNRN